MANFDVTNPVYNEKLRKLEKTDPASADVFNQLYGHLINNDVFLKHIVDMLVKETAEHMADGRIHVTQENKQAWDAKATTEVAAQNRNGLQSAADKTKLDGIAAGAEVNQDAISSVNAGGTIVQSNSKWGRISILAGSNNVAVTGDNATKQVKIAVSGGNADTLGGRAANELSVQYAATSGSANSVAWGKVSGKPSTFSPASHTHDDRYYTEAEINEKLNGKASNNHNHDSVYSKATNIINGVGEQSIVEGDNCEASGKYAHAEGYQTSAQDEYSHTEGYSTEAHSNCGHAEGRETVSSGGCSHAEGYKTKSGGYAHSEGYGTTASGKCSHTGGYHTTAGGWNHVAIGKYNLDTQTNQEMMSKPFMVGNGTDENNRRNIFSISADGQVQATGSYNTGGADYAEYLEWLDGNPDKEDRVGYFVTLDGEKIKIAKEGDRIVGIISVVPSVIGNSYEEEWCDRYEKDEWGRLQYKEVEVEEEIDNEGNLLMAAHKEIQAIRNPNYDPSMTYLPRSQRAEWDTVGMLGQLVVRDDGTCKEKDYCKCGKGGIATRAEEIGTAGSYYVMKRVGKNTIKILFK